MVTPLGASAGLRGLNSQLSSLGQKVKAAGPSLFSTSSPMAPASPTAFDRGYDSFNPSGQQTVAGTRDPFGGDIFNQSINTGRRAPFGPQQPGSSFQSLPSIGGTGTVGSLGPGLDQWDEMFQRAAAETGMDPAMLKAIASVESGGVADAVSVAGAIGIMQVMPMWGEQWGLNLYDPYQNILAGAKVLREKFNAFGSMEGAVRGYLGIGEDALGTSDSEYLQRVMAAYGQITGGGAFGSGGFDVGNPAGNSIVNIAQQYLGVSYVWGGIPGKGADPWASGWDTVHEDTDILLGYGTSKKIKDINPGDIILTYDVDGPVPVSVQMVYKKGVKAMMRIETSRTIHRTTPNHPFLVYDAKRKDSAMVNAADLNELDMLVAVRPHEYESIGADLAWVVGLMMGNGNLTQRGINLCVYGDVRDRASAILSRVTGCTPGHDRKHGIFMSCKSFSDWLRSMGLGCHAHEKRVPDAVWRWDDESRDAFLLGYLETDGSRCDTHAYAVASSSRELIVGIRDLAASLGHKVSGYRKQDRTKPISIRGKIVKHARTLYWSRIRLDPDDRAFPWDLVSVTSIRDDDPANAYDIAVDHESHTFVADGVVVSNCSGFTYWLDQNYGTGTLPRGSHYQYQNAVNTGQLFTDLSQLQPGDLVYIDTGWYGGAGGDMNAAGHVGMYIGNGKMIHAANPEQGTIISDLAAYGGILGAMHQTGSGGGYAPGINGAMAASTGRGSSLRDSLMAFYQGRR